MSTKNTRIIGLDFVKGFCILLVVLVHSIDISSFPLYMEKLIHAIFLNSFFAISGFMVYRQNKKITLQLVKGMLRKRFISLIVPYVSFSILAIVWHIILCVGLGCREVSDSYFGWTLIARDVFCAVSGLGIGTLWFLPVLFFSYALLTITVCFADSTKAKPIILTVAMIVTAIFAVYLQSAHPEAYFSGMVKKVVEEYTYTCYRIVNGYAFAVFGYLLHMVYDTGKKQIWLLMVGFAGMCLLPGFENFGASGILVLGSICLLNIEPVAALKYPVRFFVYCGKHSLAITIYHYVFLLPLEIMILKSLGFPGTGWLLLFVNLMSTLSVVYIFEKNRIAQFLLTGKTLHN